MDNWTRRVNHFPIRIGLIFLVVAFWGVQACSIRMQSEGVTQQTLVPELASPTYEQPVSPSPTISSAPIYQNTPTIFPGSIPSAILTPTATRFVSDKVIPYDSQRWVKYPSLVVTGIESSTIEDIALAPDGTLWFATTHGVSRYDGKKWTVYTSADGLMGDNLWTIAVDRNGMVWAGSLNSGKIFSFNGSSWQVFEGIGSSITSIVVDSVGAVWFGITIHPKDTSEPVHDSILRYYSGTWEEFTIPNGNPYTHIYLSDMVVDLQGNLWCGTSIGLFKFDAVDKTWRHFSTHDFWSYTSDAELGVLRVAVAPDGALWFITRHLGITRLKDGIKSNYFHPVIIDVYSSLSLYVSQDGQVWIGGGIGTPYSYLLIGFDGKQWIEYMGLQYIGTRDIFEGPDGSMWFATIVGVYQYLPQKQAP